MQVFTGSEKKAVELINKNVSHEYFVNSFFVSKQHKKKFQGQWHLVEENCFPGYIFVETDTPTEFAKTISILRGSMFMRILGMDKETYHVTSISPSEKQFIDALMNKTDEDGKKIINLSNVEVIDSKTIRVLSGPLLGYEGRIVKLDLHKRKVIVDIKLNDSIMRTTLGINISNKDEEVLKG